MKKLLFAFVTLAISVAFSANTYRFTLQEPAHFNGTSLQPGDYKVQVEGDKALLKFGKTTIEAPAKLETADRKYAATIVSFDSQDAKRSITEIQLGGTKTRIVILVNRR